MKKIMPLSALTLLALFALMWSNAQAIPFFGKSSSQKEEKRDALTQKMDKFATAQQDLKNARERAEAGGKTSSRTIGKALANLDKTSRDLRSAVTRAERRGELSERHIEDLASIRSKIESKEARRTEEGRSKPLTSEERKTLEALAKVTGKEAFVGLSDKKDPISAPRPGAPTSLQKRLDAVQDYKGVQGAQKDFDIAKQKSLDFATQVEAARQKVQKSQDPQDRLEYENLRDQQQRLNKSMAQKQNMLLIEVEAAEKSLKTAAEKSVEAPRAWTKIIQTDTDKVPSGIKIGQKSPDAPPALPSRSSLFKKETSSRFAAETEKKLSISEPQAVVAKSQIPLFEQGLKDAQKDLRVAEKDAEITRNAHLAYIKKTEKKYPEETELINKRDFEKARISEIEKNLSTDTAKTQADLKSKLSKAIESGNSQEVSAISTRLDLVAKQIDEQKKEINDRRTKLDSYEKQIQNIDSKVMNEFKKIDELGTLRKAAEAKKTDLGLEVQSIQNLLKETREKAQTTTPQTSEEKPSSSTPKDVLKRAGVSLPPQSEEDKALSQALSEFTGKKPTGQETKKPSAQTSTEETASAKQVTTPADPKKDTITPKSEPLVTSTPTGTKPESVTPSTLSPFEAALAAKKEQLKSSDERKDEPTKKTTSTQLSDPRDDVNKGVTGRREAVAPSKEDKKRQRQEEEAFWASPTP